MIVKGGDQLQEETYQIIARVWEEEDMPNRWKETIISLNTQKGRCHKV